MEETFYITTPIYYVNGVPHIGHAYTTVAADILARFNRLMGKKVFFLTGTDEHGQKVEAAAKNAGKSPKEFADFLCANFRKLWEKLNISHDGFIRTTDEKHIEIVQQMLLQLYDKGEIEKRKYSGRYCTHDERFWTEKETIDGNCPECKRPVEELEEENYFFKMSKYQDRLIDYINNNDSFILPHSRRNEVIGFLKNNTLDDLCISRPKSRLQWGVTLPFDSDFVTYVWFDALLNYYSATKYLSPVVDEKWWPADHHLVGKDIITTHSVFWPTMLMALEMELPKNIFAHGWWTSGGRKMSKSFGNVIDPFDVIEAYGADAFRFFMFREVTFGLDGDFTKDAIIGRINSNLANDLGNLASRSFTMVKKFCGKNIPNSHIIDEELKALCESLLAKMEKCLAVLEYNKAFDAIWELVTFLNKYIDTKKPWTLTKDPEKRADLESIMYNLMEGLRFISIYLYPFMPTSMGSLYKSLTGGSSIEDVSLKSDARWGIITSGKPFDDLAPLFPRIDTKKEVKDKPKESNNLIEINDFAKVELKTARVVFAEKVKGSSKLLRLEVECGSEKRQLVAGVAKHYTPEEMVGKTVVIVANLKPAKLMGIESQGMVLAASIGKELNMVTVDKEMDHGAKVR